MREKGGRLRALLALKLPSESGGIRAWQVGRRQFLVNNDEGYETVLAWVQWKDHWYCVRPHVNGTYRLTMGVKWYEYHP